MAPLPVISNVVRFTLNWSQGIGLHAANVLHFSTSLSEEDLVLAVRSHLTDNMFKATNSQAEISSYDVIKLDGTSASVHVEEAVPQTGGTFSSDSILPVCAVVSLHTALRGPSHRGRIYLPFIAEAAYSNGLIDSGASDDINEGWTTFVEDMATDLALLGVASYKLGTFTGLTSISSSRVAGTQRRRAQQLS